MAATFALSVPTIIRGVLDFLRGSKSGLYDNLASNGIYWEIVNYGVCDFIPCLC